MGSRLVSDSQDNAHGTLEGYRAADGSDLSPEQNRISVLIPVFNDWPASGLLLEKLATALMEADLVGTVLLVDDGSTTALPADFGFACSSSLESVEILALRRNVGHQRAIALGLAHLANEGVNVPVVVMDADGEDDPRDIRRLRDAFLEQRGEKIIFASRAHRSESLKFRIFYHVYKRLFGLLTGLEIRFGNFSIVPPRTVKQLVAVSELWNHYAAAVVKSRLPMTMINTARSKRLDGKSKMNFLSLVIHGLSAISVFSEMVGVRLMCASLFLAFVCGLGMGAVAAMRLLTAVAIPGWATNAFGILAILMMQAVMMSVVFVFMVLSGRSGNQFLPIRDYAYYVNTKTNVKLDRRESRTALPALKVDSP